MATTAELQAYAAAAAKREGVPVNMFLWQIGQESSWNPNAQNPKSTAGGLGQFIDSTAKMFGINKFDPYQALDAAAKYDAMLYKQHGSWQGALTAYGTLNGADAKTMAAFNDSMQGTGMDELSTTDKVLRGLKKFYDESMGPLNGNAYSDEEKAGGYDVTAPFEKYLKNGAIIILGIVVIALAILSNKTVQGVAAKAITK